MTAHTIHVNRFIEQLGRLAEGEGLPRTAGRMMGLLIIAATPLGIDEISQRLKVSRASVSTNSRLLQSLAIAQLVSEPGNRRDYLQIRGDSSTSLLSLGVRRMQSMRLAIHEMRLATDGTRSVAMRARLERMERLYDVAIDQIQAILGTWNDSQSEGGPLGSVEVNTRAVGRGRRISARKRERRERN